MKKAVGAAVALVGLFLRLFSPAHPAAATADADNDAAGRWGGISGSYKILGASSQTRETEEGLFFLLQRLRLESKPRLTPHLELHVVYDHELLLHDFSGTSDFDLIRQNNQRGLGFFDADRVISDTEHIYEKHLLRRLYLKFETDKSRWTLGKQFIDWGRLRSFSPLDIFNQPLPYSLERDERLGFDALHAEFSGGDSSSLSFLYGPARDRTLDNYGLRLSKKFSPYDTFLLLARREKENIAGAGFDGYVGRAGVRAEFTYAKNGKTEYPRVALGLDHSFTPATNVLVEYFYNGAARGDNDAFSGSLDEARRRLSVEKNLLTLQISHEINALTKFSGLAVCDLTGKSALLNPEISYNIGENFDMRAGAQVFFETKNSEFQDSHNLYYVELKYFF